MLYRFQLPAANGSREACEPHPERCIPNNEMWVKKRSITHPAGHKSVLCQARAMRGTGMNGYAADPFRMPSPQKDCRGSALLLREKSGR